MASFLRAMAESEEFFLLGHPARRIGMTNLEPDEFAYLRLGLYDWQIETLWRIGQQPNGGPPVTVRAANGSGKTTGLRSELDDVRS